MAEAQIIHSNIAPWAEIVPGAGPATVDDLLTMPDDEWVYEVVEGVLVRMAGSGDLAATIGLLLGSILVAYVRPLQLGRVTGSDGVYKFPGARTGLLPDVGYYGAHLFPRVVDREKPIPFAPELAIEVASPRQSAGAMAAKARRYLRGGTLLVWVVWPHSRTIDVWRRAGSPRGGTDLRPSAVLHEGDLLDGEDVVPGFSHPVADVFDV